MNNPGEILSKTLEAFGRRLDCTGLDMPDRRYVQVGEVVFDCPQFTVSGSTVVAGATGQPGQSLGATPQVAPFFHLDVAVTIVRNAAGLLQHEDDYQEMPEAEDITRDALRAATDGQRLTEAFYEIFTADGDEVVGPCDNVWYAGITWVGPEGGLLATILTFQVQL